MIPKILSYLVMYGRKILDPPLKRSYYEWAIKGLNEEMNRDLERLSRIPRGPYVTLSGEGQKTIDDLNDSPVIEMIVDRYRNNSMVHLWNIIPDGEEKNELRAKKSRIEEMLRDSNLSKDPLISSF